MNEQHETVIAAAPGLRAAAFGAALAAALGALVRMPSALDALRVLAAALLAASFAVLLRQRSAALRTLPARSAPASDLRLLVAGCAAGAVLWLLAPWSQSAPSGAAELARATSAAEARWLCTSSLLGTPYVVPRGRVLLAADRGRASLLHACALRRARGSVELAPPRPLRRGVTPVRARARSAAHARHDLVLVAVQAPGHPLPLGVLPFADAPLETREGVRDLLALVAPDGVVAATMLGEPAMLRWLQTARAALTDMGVTAIEHHFVVYGAAGAYTVLTRATPFDADSVLAMHGAQRAPAEDPPASMARWPAWLRTRPSLQATPGSPFDTRAAAELRPEGGALRGGTYVFDIRPTSDDRPAFYEITRGDRPQTWAASTSYWLLAWSLALTLALAAALCWSASRLHAGAQLGAAPRARLLAQSSALAFAHTLAFAFAQHRAATWLLRPLDVSALCVLVLAIVGGAVFALPVTLARRSRLLASFWSLLALALLLLLLLVRTPSPELAARWGQGALAWAALAGLVALAAALAFAAKAALANLPDGMRGGALVSYLAMLAPASLLAPLVTLHFGVHACAVGTMIALAIHAFTATAPTVLAGSSPRSA